MNTVNTCGNCGAKNFITRKFCGNCGAPLYEQGNNVNIRPEKVMGITYTQSLLLGLLVIVVIIIGSVLVWQFGFNQSVPQAQSVNVTVQFPPGYGQNMSGAGPQITGATALMVGDTTATIIWYTDVPSSSQVEYGRVLYSYGMLIPFAPQDDPSQGGTGVTYHSISLHNMTSGATYYFRVKSKDAYGRESVSADGTYFKTNKTLDFASPD
jgi:hypothetical protein